jgi:copper/silver-translocating P-type ATPase
MTCTSCANRISRKLNKLPGVDAVVNFATEEASVTFDPSNVRIEDLIEAVRAAGYDASLKEDKEVFSTARQWLIFAVSGALALALNVITISGAPVPTWVQAFLAAIALLLTGSRFYTAAAKAIRHGSVSMDTLVALGSGIGFLYSVVAVILGLRGPYFFDASATIVTVIYLGKVLEDNSKLAARSSLEELKKLSAGSALVLQDNQEIETPISALQPGQLVVVKAGQLVPADGRIRDGSGVIEAKAITGEPLPRTMQVGDQVAGGSILRQGRIVVELEAVGAQTIIGQVADLVIEAQSRKAKLQRLADRVSAFFVPAVIAVALVVALVRYATHSSLGETVGAAVTILVVACPCALGLATPMAFLVGTARAAREGVLITNPDVLEAAGRIDTIAFDKTGTVTSGEIKADLSNLDDYSRKLVGSLAAFSDHPVSRSLSMQVDDYLPVEEAVEEIGKGLTGIVDGHEVKLGSQHYVGGKEAIGKAVFVKAVFVKIDANEPIAIALEDPLRSDATEAIALLGSRGYDLVMLSGDDETHTKAIAEALGLQRYFANVSPGEKAQIVKQLQGEGRRVAMVGDGINDAAALAQADVAISLAQAAELAKSVAGITLVNSNITAVAYALELATKTLRNIKQNLSWAFGYNVVAIPLAVAGILSPIIAAVLMASSSVIVVTNASRLRRA